MNITDIRDATHLKLLTELGLFKQDMFKPKMSFSITTFNVRCYQNASPSEISFFLESVNADVVCLQEHVSTIFLPTKKYILATQCKAEKLSKAFANLDHIENDDVENDVYMCNAIYVKKSFLQRNYWRLQTDGVVFPHYNLESIGSVRCATIVDVGGIRIANMHLSGGRDDDRFYKALAQEKAEQIKEVVKKWQPDIILGDLNAESSEHEARMTLMRYNLYRNLQPFEKEEFLKFYLCGHKALESLGYKTVQTEQQVRPTSVYGGVPDWIYVKADSKCSLVGVEKLQTIPKLSDHNALIGTIFIQ